MKTYSSNWMYSLNFRSRIWIMVSQVKRKDSIRKMFDTNRMSILAVMIQKQLMWPWEHYWKLLKLMTRKWLNWLLKMDLMSTFRIDLGKPLCTTRPSKVRFHCKTVLTFNAMIYIWHKTCRCWTNRRSIDQKWDQGQFGR